MEARNLLQIFLIISTLGNALAKYSIGFNIQGLNFNNLPYYVDIRRNNEKVSTTDWGWANQGIINWKGNYRVDDLHQNEVIEFRITIAKEGIWRPFASAYLKGKRIPTELSWNGLDLDVGVYSASDGGGFVLRIIPTMIVKGSLPC